MSDVFISYAREDRDVAARLARIIEQDGHSVFWDRELVPGTAFAEVLAAELQAAGRVVVLWSRASVGSLWVRDEAEVGLKRNVLTPVLIEAVDLPLGFGSIHAADLAGWTGSPDDPRLASLLAVLRGEPPPLIVPPPLPRQRSRWRRAVWGGAAAAVILGGVVVALSGRFQGADERPAFRPLTWEMPADHPAFSTFSDCAGCPEMVAIPPGPTLIGALSSEKGSQSDERPAVPVQIKQAFAISAREITFDQWQRCVDDGGCRDYRPDDEGWGRGQRPVIFVSWDQAQAYAAWLSRKTGQAYRLPTEAEWEYACRAGAATRYAFGETVSADKANFGRSKGGTVPAGTYPPNAWGLSDLHGNVWEWVEDVWSPGHRGRPDDQRPRLDGPDPDTRTVRGGSWDDPPHRVTCASRNRKDRDQRENEIGFRVARSF
jgi:formylglycine-generating enzyme required for sulfatase activity